MPPTPAGLVARNSLFGLLALGIDKAAFMVVALALARYLGPTDFGRYAFIMTYLGVFQIIADLGMEMILVRRMSQEPGARDRLLANALAMRLASGAVCWALAIALVPLAADASYLPLAVIAGSSLVSSSWNAYKILYRSIMRIEFLLVMVAFNAGATALGVLAVIARRGTLTTAVVAIAAGSAVCLPFAAWLARRFSPLRLRIEPALWRSILREAVPLGVNAVLVNLSLRIGPLMLIQLRGPEDVAYFSAASKLVEAFCLLPEVPMLTIFPLMAAVQVDGGERLGALSRAATKWIVILLFPLVLAVGALAEPILVVMYGEQFRPASQSLRLLVWATGFSATGVVWIGVLTALGHQRVLVRFYGVAIAVNIALCMVLIPRLGSAGAAAAAVAAAAVSQGLLVWFPASAAYIRPAFRGVAPAFSVAAILAVAASVSAVSPLVAAAGCITVYAIAILGTGAFGAEEWALARRLAGRGK